MGLDIVSKSDNHFEVTPRPKIVQKPPHGRAKVDEKETKALLKNRYHNLRRLDGNYRNSNSMSTHRKSMPERLHCTNPRKSEPIKRGSVYQSSREVRSMSMLTNRTSNLEPAFSDEAFLSFEIVDPLPRPSSNEATKSTEHLELSFRDLPEEQAKPINSSSGLHTKEQRAKGSIEEQKSSKDLFFHNEINGNNVSKRDNRCNLPKSFSAKEPMFKPRCIQTARDVSAASPKSRFCPFKKMLYPILKSKSLREIGDRTLLNDFRKSSLHDFSIEAKKMNCDDGSTKRDQDSTLVYLPSHLHAILKSNHINGAQSYEFAIGDAEDVLMASTWRTDSAFSWVYTFHNRKKKSILIGQMQASCYICSEVSNDESLESSLITKSTLYDISQSGESGSHPSIYPLTPMDLHPYLEIAAIMVQTPFDRKETTSECMNHVNVKAAIPSGVHAGPCNEENCPSSLLDRWRIGGGCDCGGWDMACPIVVLDNLLANDVGDHLVKGTRQRTVLFVQGRKEKIPAISISGNGNGQYAIDFHGQLSPLQTFSICISILHSSEAASALVQDNKQNLCSNSLKLLLEEEAKHLLKAFTEEEKKISRKKVEEHQPSFILGSPFSRLG